MTEIKLQVGSQHVLRDHLRKATGLLAPGTDARHTLEEALAQIEEQLPAVEEPTEFGSIVRATSDKLFVLADTTGDDDMRWCGQEGLWVRFANLGAVEVLRVGIGETPGDAYARGYEDGVESNLPSPVDRSVIRSALQELGWFSVLVDQATEAVMKALAGGESNRTWMVHPGDLLEVVRQEFTQLKSEAITAPEKRCYDTALATVAVLLEDS